MPPKRSTLIETNLPLRLDQLPWSRFHWLVVVALGITWMLDGLEVTVMGAVASVLEQRETLGLSSTQIGWAGSAYIFGAIVGALIFGRLTDHFSRKRLFLITLALYVAATTLTALSGALLLGVGLLFRAEQLTATTQAIAFSLVFFFGSAAASSAYLSVSELFPIELRALAIASFFAVGTAVGGLAAPALFGYLIQTGEPREMFYGYALRAGLMLGAAVVAAVFGVAAEGRSLEEISRPLSSDPRPYDL